MSDNQTDIEGQQYQSQGTASSQSTIDSQQTLDSQDPDVVNFRLGHALLKDISEQNKAYFDAISESEARLPDGGLDFDWHNYAIESLGFEWQEDDVTSWIDNASNVSENRLEVHAEDLTLPAINLLRANPLQRLIISININKL